jgi:hypothetical protein
VFVHDFQVRGTGLVKYDSQQIVVEDATSIDQRGRFPWPSEGIIVEEGTTTGLTANQECLRFAHHYVVNRAQPRTRVDALTVKSVRTNHSAATATWALLSRADIADIIGLQHGYPGDDGVGLDEDLNIEGIEMSVVPLNTEIDNVEATYFVSPPDPIDVFAQWSNPGDPVAAIDPLANAGYLVGTSGTVEGDNTDATTEDADELAVYQAYNPGATDVPSVWYRWKNLTGAAVTFGINSLVGDAGFAPDGPEVDAYRYDGPGVPSFADLSATSCYIGAAGFGGTPTSDSLTVQPDQ